MHLDRTRVCLLALGLACATTSVAHAQSLTGNTGSASITAGERGVEWRVGFNANGDAAARIHYDHAFSDWYQLRVIGAFRQPDGGAWDYGGLTLENWFQWRKEADDGTGFNGGARLAYAFNDGGGPDEIDVRLAITDELAGLWEWRANAIGEIQTGQGSVGGVFLETRAQITRAFPAAESIEFRLGAELLSELGNSRDLLELKDQAHQLGPLLNLRWGSGSYLQTAVRFGLTDASDDMTLRLVMGREF
jgi:hypothetical protein